MGRQNSDSTAIHSSIALLQERFRQLQKVKEMREEREHLRLSSDSKRVSPNMRYEPSRQFFHPDLILSPGPPLQGSLSFRANLQGKHTDIRTIDTPVSTDLWPTNRVNVHTAHNFDDADIDTSLHL